MKPGLSVSKEVNTAWLGQCSQMVSTPPIMTSPSRGVSMAEKSPSQHNAKKVGKTLKEKRNEKHAKKESKKGLMDH